MKEKKSNRKGINNGGGILDLGLRVLIVITFIAIVYYFFEQSVYGNQSQSVTQSGFNQETFNTTPTPAVNQFEWKTYQSKEFGFSLRYPASLLVNDLGNVGGYIDFIRFEEEPNLNLSDKGIAVGVSTLPLDKEIAKIKNQIKTEGGAVLADESKIDFKGFSSIQLYYKPEDPEEEEERVIIIVNTGKGYTYSISTVPVQMPKVIQGFNFIES